MGHLGNAAARTPVLDALAGEAVSFRNAFCQSPVCTPSRCSFMTGWYPHTRGHRTMHHLLHAEHGERNLLGVLKEAGYYVFWAGKNDLIPGNEDPSSCCDVRFRATPEDYVRWGVTKRPDGHVDVESVRGAPDSDTFYSFFGGRLEKAGEPYYANTDWASILGAIDMIRNHTGDRPLCIYLSLTFPHPPYFVEEPWFSAIDRSKLPPRTPTPNRREVLPRMMRGLLESQNLGGWSEERWTELRATYYGMCSRVDHQLGLVCDALRQRGFWDDTALFFFSDHGDYTGDFGLVEKAQNLFHDCLVRVPFLIRPPRGTPSRPGISDALVELVDFPATVAELCGLDLGHHHFGRSLLPLIAGQTSKHREAVFAEGGRLPGEVEASERESVQEEKRPERGLYWPRMRLQLSEAPFSHGKAVMVRNARYKLVERLHETSELYDLLADPAETENRIADPALKEVRQELERLIMRWLIETADVVPRRTDSRVSAAPSRNQIAPR